MGFKQKGDKGKMPPRYVVRWRSRGPSGRGGRLVGTHTRAEADDLIAMRDALYRDDEHYAITRDQQRRLDAAVASAGPSRAVRASQTPATRHRGTNARCRVREG